MRKINRRRIRMIKVLLSPRMLLSGAGVAVSWIILQLIELDLWFWMGIGKLVYGREAIESIEREAAESMETDSNEGAV